MWQQDTQTRVSPCILAGCCVPWTESFEVHEELFRRLIRSQLDRGHRNLYLFGTAGEGYAVTLGQFERISRIFVEETEGRTAWRQLGIIALSLPQVQERIEVGRALGVGSFQLSLPSWGRLNDREVDVFFEGTCGRYPECSFLFYNVPRGLRILSGAELGALAGRHPNLVAVKWAGRHEVSAMKDAVEGSPELCCFFTDPSHVQARLAGLRCGLLISIGASNRLLASELFELGQSRSDDGRLREYLDELQRHSTILRELPGEGSRIDGAYDKLICKLNLPDFPLRLLPPYQSIDEEVFQLYLTRLQAELPHWLEPPP